MRDLKVITIIICLLFFVSGCEPVANENGTLEVEGLDISEGSVTDTSVSDQEVLIVNEEDLLKQKIEEKVTKLINHGESKLKERLKDPDSVRLRSQSYSSGSDELIDFDRSEQSEFLAVPFSYCFEYNAKNSMGGYVGYRGIMLRLYYLEEGFTSTDTDEILDYYIDGLHFAYAEMYESLGKEIPEYECEIEEPSSDINGIVDNIYDLLYKDKSETP